MILQSKHHFKDTTTIKFQIPGHASSSKESYQFVAKCGIYQLMADNHPSLSELYKIRYDEHGELRLNDYQKILKKRLTTLVWEIKDLKDLQLHILIPKYSGNYFSFCILISSLQLFPPSSDIETLERSREINRLFSSYNNFAVNHSDLVTLHLDQMEKDEIQDLFRISYSETNSGDLLFQLSINPYGIPSLLFEEYRTELGIHEIEVLQNLVNFQVKYNDLPLIQLNARYSRSIGWDLNDQLISITKPRKIATFGNERIMLQALLILQSFHLKHKVKMREIIDPKVGNRSPKQDIVLTTEHCYLVLTTKVDDWSVSLQELSDTQKYLKEIPRDTHRLSEIGVDLIQLFQKDRNLLIEILRSWVNIANSSYSAAFEMQLVLELFEDTFKTYGHEQLNEFQLRMFLKESTYDDLLHEELHNTLISKYAAIFNHSFFNFKEKFDTQATNSQRRLWKKDIFSPGIHVIDISDATLTEQIAIQSFFIVLQEAHYFKKTWTLHSFGEGLRHSFEKVEQVLKGIAITRSLLHFTHIVTIPDFIRSHELMLFDKEFSTTRALKTLNADKLFEKSGDASLLVYEQVDTTLMKAIQSKMLDRLYDMNVMVRLAPDQIYYSYDEFPAKELNEVSDQAITNNELKVDVKLNTDSSVFSQPFTEEVDRAIEEYEEDNYIGPDLQFKIPVLATLKTYKQYLFQDIEYRSNLPRDIVEQQLENLLSQRWIETTIVNGKDVYLPLNRGKDYVDGFLKQVPDLSSLHEEIFDLVYPELDLADDAIKQITRENILDALIATRLLYHNNTDSRERKDLLLKICSMCKFISDTFTDYDELESYYFWTVGVYASFLEIQLGNKRDEHLLIIKITEIVKAISDILAEKLQNDFSTEQFEVSSDEEFIFTEKVNDENKEFGREIQPDSQPTKPKKSPKIIPEPIKSTPVAKSSHPPTVLNIPKASLSIPRSDRQLTPKELKPISFSRGIGAWYKYHRIDYDILISVDPLTLSPDDIIFMYMVNSMNNKSVESFNFKKEMRTLMFLNREQLEATAHRSPLPLEVNYDNLIKSGVLNKVDLGYTIIDIRSVLPDPQVNVDPMHKRMNLNEVIDLIDENKYNFIHSRMLQSYIYADYYDLELQPVVAICYSLLTDTSSTSQKVQNYGKYIPWAYTIIKLFMLKKRDVLSSNALDFIHSSLVTKLQKIHVNSSLELLKYSGDNDLTKTLQFLLRRKLLKLGIESSDINKHAQIDSLSKKDQPKKSEKKKAKKNDREKFSPTLVQQLEAETLVEEHDRPLSNPIKQNRPKKKTTRSTNKVKSGSLENQTVSQPSTENEIKLSDKIIAKIEGFCKKAVMEAENLKPTDFLVSLFSEIIYPGVIGRETKIKDLRLIETFNEVGELSSISNTVDFSRNLGDMQERWDKYKETRTRVIRSFSNRIQETAKNFVYNDFFKDLLQSKIRRVEKVS